MTSSEIRQSFLDFFKSKGHTIVPSAPVIPHGDKTLLFTNAGMNQFKDVFLGEGTRPYTRAVDTQKCLRVSGKHNDLEEVGHDTYHHTLFEMLGNWSFGDYYKKEAIGWAWELLTKVWGLDKSRIYATVYEHDDEALEVWKTVTDIDPTHIQRHGAKDNFWEMGETGPCGPCSEIHFDRTPDKSGGPLVNAGVPEVIEVWNNVFIQHNRRADGTLEDLPAKHVDTGMGFERICAVMQGKDSNYDTDVFMPYIKWQSEKSEIAYGTKEEADIAMRVISDHVRALTCAIADGALPGNEGRGYVLRRILRRAARYGRKLGFTEPFLCELSAIVVATMGVAFPELRERKDLVYKVLKAEEESFNATLDRGLELINKIIDSISPSLRAAEEARKQAAPALRAAEEARKQAAPALRAAEEARKQVAPALLAIEEGKKQIGFLTGEDTFKLYDTFGFPIDLTVVIAKEKGLSVDTQRFEELLAEQKQRSKSVHQSKKHKEIALTEIVGVESEFLGYEKVEADGKVLLVSEDMIVLDKTPFYAESGGQVSDTGMLLIGGNPYRVTDVRKLAGGTAIAHVIEADELDIADGISVHGSVDKIRRSDIERNHSATHLMHSALRQILGEHVHQAGSLVNEKQLRFDFSHYQKVSDEEIRAIEELVNEKLREAIPLIHHRNIPFEEAKKMGALMFFGDKYGAKVNVVDFGPFSREFCGGTHVKNSSEIGLFKLVSESSIASGTRRIEAVTGRGIEQWLYNELSKSDELSREREKLEDEKRKLEKEIAKLKLGQRLDEAKQIVSSAKTLDGTSIKVMAKEVAASSGDEFKAFAEMVQQNIGNGTVIVLGGKPDDKVSLIAIVSDDVAKEKKVQAGKLVGVVAEIVGGKGGGKPTLAQAGGKYPEKLGDALLAVDSIIKGML